MNIVKPHRITRSYTQKLDAPPDQVLALNRCHDKLESQDELGHKVVLFPTSSGMTLPEIAEILEVSHRSLERKWTFIRAWLARELAAT